MDKHSEYVFKLDELKKMLTEAAAMEKYNYVGISVHFSRDGASDKEFRAQVKATAMKYDKDSGFEVDNAAPSVTGCPNPPSCQ